MSLGSQSPIGIPVYPPPPLIEKKQNSHNLESLHLTARIAKRGFAAQLTGFREVESFSMTKISH